MIFPVSSGDIYRCRTVPFSQRFSETRREKKRGKRRRRRKKKERKGNGGASTTRISNRTARRPQEKSRVRLLRRGTFLPAFRHASSGSWTHCGTLQRSRVHRDGQKVYVSPRKRTSKSYLPRQRREQCAPLPSNNARRSSDLVKRKYPASLFTGFRPRNLTVPFGYQWVGTMVPAFIRRDFG